jgi:hypothetical protein
LTIERLRAKQGDLHGAVAKLTDINQRGSHGADPLKVRDDLLAKQGRPINARAKHDEALKCAPNWKELRQAREALAKHAG